VGRGGHEERLDLGGRTKPPQKKAGRPYRDEERIKLWARWGHVDLALNPSWARGQGRVDRQTPRLEAGLGKTHRPEF
jgi:hypothetical protein